MHGRRTSTEHEEAPLPADALARYEAVVPGSSERIERMLRAERRAFEASVATKRAEREHLVQGIVAFVVALAVAGALMAGPIGLVPAIAVLVGSSIGLACAHMADRSQRGARSAPMPPGLERLIDGLETQRAGFRLASLRTAERDGPRER